MKTLFTFIGNLLTWIWKAISFTRQLLLNLIFIGVVAGIYYFVTVEHPINSTAIDSPPKKQALLLDLSGPIVEKQRRIDPYDLATQSLFGQQVQVENILYDLVEQIRAAAKDDNINGMVLKLTDMSETSLTKMRYIAKSIEEFKLAGKEVIAIGGHYNQSQYYLSSYADEIYMPPDGAVLLQGYGTYNLYIKDLLDNLDIETHVFRVGTYKSFVEPYTRTAMSDQAREANSVWLNQLWGAYLADVAINRGSSIEVLSPTADFLLAELKSVNGDFAQLSLKMGLVDALLTRPQMREKLAEKFGPDEKNDTFQYVSIYDYQPSEQSLPKENQIAVVVVSGAIIDGAETKGTSGGDTIASLLRKARLDENIKAVVLRIDSPGGSAFASEVIRVEVEAMKKANKPIVVSMSSVAASGGYWIAASANRILAQPTTITGSIGVFGILTTFEKTLGKYGVYNDGIGTTPFAGVGISRALPEKIGEIMQLGVESTYDRFINLVSNQRQLSIENVEDVAQGRVWTGFDAMRHGLVDQMGDFDAAIASAAKLANIEDYSLNWMEESLTATQQILYNLINNVITKLNLGANIQLGAIPKILTDTVLTQANQIANFNDPNGQYALCSTCNYYQD